MPRRPVCRLALHSLEDRNAPAIIVGGSTLLDDAKAAQLESWLGEGGIVLTNIFSRTAGDGKTSTDFHAAADGKGRTFSLIQVLATQGNLEQVIGGYNPQSWNTIGNYTTTPNDADRTAFVFNLTTTTRQSQKLGSMDSNAGINQTYGRIDYGPTFGGGHDIFTSPNLATGYVRQHSYGAPGIYGVNIMAGADTTYFDNSTIEVFTISDAPDIQLAGNNVNENQPVQTLVGSFSTLESTSGKTYTYSLVSGAGDSGNSEFDIAGNALRTGASFDFETQSSYSIRIRSTDQFNFSVEENFTIQVLDITDETQSNRPPVLSGVPVSKSLNEGEMFNFTATATDPDPNPSLSFSLDGEPDGATINPMTGAFTWTTDEDDGPDTYVFNVQVTDGVETTVRTITVIVREVNQAPLLADVPASITVVRGMPVRFTAKATDTDSINGEGNSLTYSLVGSLPGATIDPDSGEFYYDSSLSDQPIAASLFVRVADDGVSSKKATLPVDITVLDAAILGDDLVVGGTSANDTIAVALSRDKTLLNVMRNKESLGTFLLDDVDGRIVVRGLAGNDRVTISPKIPKPADLYGGSGKDSLTGGVGDDRLFGEAGDDRLMGGKGNNLLVGGDGNDMLTGGIGRDVLIGGAGTDRLSGGVGDDLLVAGKTDFDANLVGLADIVREWTANTVTDTYANRVMHLSDTLGGGLNGGTFLLAATVDVDSDKDTLSGSVGNDWFVISGLDKVDLKTGEQPLVIA
jgi:Ca2+-binding RTX toxin-like protein